MVQPGDEIFAITSGGGVIRTSANEVKQSGRQTMGVRLMNLAAGDSVVGLARNAESLAEADAESLAEGDQEPEGEESDQDLAADLAESTGSEDEADRPGPDNEAEGEV
jgi:DNA gyrase subunit A